MSLRSYFEDEKEITGLVMIQDPSKRKEIEQYITEELSSRVGPYLHNLQLKDCGQNDGWHAVSFVIKKIKKTGDE